MTAFSHELRNYLEEKLEVSINWLILFSISSTLLFLILILNEIEENNGVLLYNILEWFIIITLWIAISYYPSYIGRKYISNSIKQKFGKFINFWKKKFRIWVILFLVSFLFIYFANIDDFSTISDPVPNFQNMHPFSHIILFLQGILFASILISLVLLLITVRIANYLKNKYSNNIRSAIIKKIKKSNKFTVTLSLGFYGSFSAVLFYILWNNYPIEINLFIYLPMLFIIFSSFKLPKFPTDHDPARNLSIADLFGGILFL